ncbi:MULTISPECIES: hypothetical protein [unclassified Dysgonomonas]|uniref:hypothetical protein n=1 Tax=unclassified Dysgonomonas TaxID=2630389 RepID=UPI0013ECE483|nr:MULTISPECIES: hypothetical protein [unclassified Dysgonomonas]
MNTKKFTTEELSELKLSSIAKKHGCTTGYVRHVLTGVRERKSVLAQKIVKDVMDMVEILERETKIMV